MGSGETLFGIEEACERYYFCVCDAAVMSGMKYYQALPDCRKSSYFSHGFAIT